MRADTVVKIWALGVGVDILLAIARMLYAFISTRTLRRNLEKIGLRYDWLTGNINIEMPVEPFQKIKARVQQLSPIFSIAWIGWVFSWIHVVLRLYAWIALAREKARLNPEQRAALATLKSNEALSLGEVREMMQAWDDLVYAKAMTEPGSIPIVGVDGEEFSRLFAQAMLNERCRKILPSLLGASNGIFTWREAAILKYVLGEEDKNYLLKTIEERTKTPREADIWKHQTHILVSAFPQEDIGLTEPALPTEQQTAKKPSTYPETIQCWKCRYFIDVTPEIRGKTVRCPRCRQRQAMPL